MEITRPHISPYSMDMTRTFIFSLVYEHAPILFLFLDITRALFLPYSMYMTKTPIFFLSIEMMGAPIAPIFLVVSTSLFLFSETWPEPLLPLYSMTIMNFHIFP